MKSLSVKVDQDIFLDTEEILKELKMPRNRYINEAIAQYNNIQRRKLLREQYKKDSERVRDNSLNVLKEFEHIEYGD